MISRVTKICQYLGIRFAYIFAFGLLGSLPLDVVWFDLIAQFKPHFLAFGFMALLCFLVLKKWRYLGLLLLPIVWQSYSIYQIHRVVNEAAKPLLLSLLHSNVLSSNTHHQALFLTLQQHSSDIISLQEVSPQWADKLAVLKHTHPHYLSYPQSDNFGLAVYSRYPIIQYKVFYFTPDIPTLFAQIQLPQDTLWFVSTHPFPPIGPQGYQWRNQQYQQLVKEIRLLKGKVIVAGDFNSTLYAPSYQSFLVETQLQHIRQGHGLLATWPHFLGSFGIGIDHLLFSSSLSPQEVKVLPSLGSDHFPLWVKF